MFQSIAPSSSLVGVVHPRQTLCASAAHSRRCVSPVANVDVGHSLQSPSLLNVPCGPCECRALLRSTVGVIDFLQLLWALRVSATPVGVVRSLQPLWVLCILCGPCGRYTLSADPEGVVHCTFPAAPVGVVCSLWPMWVLCISGGRCVPAAQWSTCVLCMHRVIKIG